MEILHLQNLLYRSRAQNDRTSGVKLAANCGVPAGGGELGHYGKESGADLTHYVTDPGYQHAVDEHTHTIGTAVVH